MIAFADNGTASSSGTCTGTSDTVVVFYDDGTDDFYSSNLPDPTPYYREAPDCIVSGYEDRRYLNVDQIVIDDAAKMPIEARLTPDSRWSGNAILQTREPGPSAPGGAGLSIHNEYKARSHQTRGAAELLLNGDFR